MEKCATSYSANKAWHRPRWAKKFEARGVKDGIKILGDAAIALRADFVSIKVDCGMMTGIVRSMMMMRKRSDTWKVLVHSYITPEEFTICDLKSFWKGKSVVFCQQNSIWETKLNYLRDDDVKGGMKDIVFDSVWMVDLLHPGQPQGGEGELVSQRGDGKGAGGSEGDGRGGVDADIGLSPQQAK